LPAVLFAYLAHPQPARYVGLRKPVKGLHLLLSVLLILGAMPILEEIQALVSHIDLGASVKESQAASEAMMKSFLTMPSFVDFLRAFLVMAIIPAAGEELFFRGVLMRFAYKGTKSMWFSVLFTSFIFASTHSNVYGLFSIFLAGALLASIYYLTSSIWCGILAHMCFNGTQVVLSYFAKSSPAVKAMVESDSISIGLLVAGALVFSGALYLLLKTKTPLAPNWADDFDTPPPPAQFPGFDSLS
jgi:hypothetical protein